MAQGWGRIVNISGGITVTVVHPGLTRTETLESALARRADRESVPVADLESELATNSIRRVIDASEVADVVAFLASPRSIAITGDAIAAGGGVPGPVYY